MQAFTTVPVLDVADTNPAEGELLDIYFGYSNLSMDLTAPLDVYQEIENLVQLSPAITNVNYTLGENARRIYISGSFEPNQQYTVTLSADLKDRWGETYCRERAIAFPHCTLASRIEYSYAANRNGYIDLHTG